MGAENINRRLALIGLGTGVAGLCSVAWGFNNLKKSHTGVVQAAGRPTDTAGTTPLPPTKTVTPETLTSTNTPQPQPTVRVEAPQGISMEELEKKKALRGQYETLLRLDREEKNLFVKIDANIVILPLDETEDFKIDINGEQLAPAVSLIKTWVLLHGVFKNPWKEETINGKDAYEMMVNSNNFSTADYICKNAVSNEVALDDINAFLHQAVGLNGYVGITNWTFAARPALHSHVPLDARSVSDQRLMRIDNPTTLADMVQTLALMESEEKIREVAQKAWNLGYGQDYYFSFEQYVNEVNQAMTAAKVLMSQRSTDPNAETELEQAIAAANFSQGSESDYGKGGTIGNLVEGWNRGRYVTEMRVITLKRGSVVRKYAVAYSAWSFKTEKFLTDALSYMVEMTKASK